MGNVLFNVEAFVKGENYHAPKMVGAGSARWVFTSERWAGYL